MFLSDIVKVLKPIAVYGEENIHITNVTNHSKKIKTGGLFICISGFSQNGHLYVAEALKRGAIAIVTEYRLPIKVTQIIVENARLAQAVISQVFYQYPSSELQLIGITGTNGKTTTTYLTEAILSASGHSTGMISTVECKVGQDYWPSKHTTPDALELGEIFRRMVDNKVTSTVMEVSSHALELSRVAGCDFLITAFTNITRDHFEFHRNFSNYLKAKAKLFAQQGDWSYKSPEELHAVFNIDDPHSQSMIQVAQAKNIWTYGIKNSCQVQVINYELQSTHSSFRVRFANKYFDFFLPIPGIFSIYNALAAITIGLSLNVQMDVIIDALAHFPGVPGRCEYIKCGQDFQVMVDFAHNPSGLYNVLTTIPFPNCHHKKIVVFGCEGGKDPGKRAPMGSIAARHADYCVITSDNVYHEDPLKIAQDIERGIILEEVPNNKYKIVLDRYEAINYALSIAKPGDTVIIAGKGHETTQVINNTVLPFNDRLIVQEILGGTKTNAKRTMALDAAYN